MVPIELDDDAANVLINQSTVVICSILMGVGGGYHYLENYPSGFQITHDMVQAVIFFSASCEPK